MSLEFLRKKIILIWFRCCPITVLRYQITIREYHKLIILSYITKKKKVDEIPFFFFALLVSLLPLQARSRELVLPNDAEWLRGAPWYRSVHISVGASFSSVKTLEVTLAKYSDCSLWRMGVVWGNRPLTTLPRMWDEMDVEIDAVAASFGNWDWMKN